MNVLHPQLTTEEKRQAVYSSYCRFGSEALSLRQRAIRRVVLGALLGSTKQEPFRIGRIEQNLTFGSLNFGIRVETIQDALDQLTRDGKVEHILHRDRHAYLLTPSGDEEVSSYAVSSENLFQDAGSKLFRDTKEFLPFDLALQVFRKFSFECFARFGQQIAKTSAGISTKDNSLRRIDARNAFEAAINGLSISLEQRETLEVRCHQFIAGSDPSFDRLKFYLTQGYFFTQLLGLEQTKFNPLAEQAFSGAVFYVDTNVLLIGLLYAHEDQDDFLEMIKLSQRLGIELRVTTATIKEVHKVITDRIPKIKKIKKVLPGPLAERTNDQILMAFNKASEENQSLSVEEFFGPILDLENTLPDHWHIIIDNRDSGEIINSRDIVEISKVMDEEAKNSRGWGKSQPVLEHDAAHFLLVCDERESNPKTWFLTRDRSLEAVSNRLNPDITVFSFSHVGFLHSISPFVTTPEEEFSLADVMFAFISDQIRPIESLFDISELSIMAEYHEDVMATPPDQLIMAFDYIKSRTLKGEPYREGDIPKVSLELRKFLSSDRNEQLQVLHDERHRLVEEAKEERERRLAAEEVSRREIERRANLEVEVSELQRTLTSTQDVISDINKRLKFQEEQTEAERQKNRFVFIVIGLIFGLPLLITNSQIARNAVVYFPALASYGDWMRVGLRVVSILLMVIPLLFYIRKTNRTKDFKVVAYVIISIVAIAISHLIPNDELSHISDIIGVGTLVGTIIAMVLIKEKS